jgi:hypothetical protein
VATTDEREALEALDTFEDGLVARFRSHPVLVAAPRLTERDLHAVLLQRRFVSHQFTPAYDLVIDLLEDEEARRIARAILREEYPDGSGHTPSHREDMVSDLLALGITRRAIAESRETLATRRAIADAVDLIRDAGRRPDADLRLLTILRFWGEVLVAVEYSSLWERMAPAFAGEVPSRFYRPHLLHDAKTHPLATVSLLSSSHSDRLATRLQRLVARDPAGATAAFEEVEHRVVALKTAFYDQFLPAVPADG